MPPRRSWEVESRRGYFVTISMVDKKKKSGRQRSAGGATAVTTPPKRKRTTDSRPSSSASRKTGKTASEKMSGTRNEKSLGKLTERFLHLLRSASVSFGFGSGEYPHLPSAFTALSPFTATLGPPTQYLSSHLFHVHACACVHVWRLFLL